MELTESTYITPYLVDKLTRSLGEQVWVREMSGTTPLKNLFKMNRRIGHMASAPIIRQAIGMVLSQCSIEECWGEVQDFLTNNQKETGLLAINIQPWAGKTSEYWTGHPLEIPATLIACNLPSAALYINRDQWEKVQNDGTNLAYLFMHDEQAWNSWVKAGRSIDEPVYIDMEGNRTSTPTPMYQWMARRGNLYKGVSKRIKADGGDIAFEEQLKGKGWRSAIGRRDNWRQWTGSSGKNALHIVARHHPASFLTSQAKVIANRGLLGEIDHNGDGCINHMIIGMLANFPEQRRAYWNNALARFSETINLIERENKEKGTGNTPRGIIAALIDTDEMPYALRSSWQEMLGGGIVSGWLKAKPKRIWGGMDHECAMKMIQNYSHMKKFANFISNMLLREIENHPSEEFLNTSPEARLVLLSMMLSNPGRSYLTGSEKRWNRVKKLFEETMEEEMEFPDHAMETYKNILEAYGKHIKIREGQFDHLEVVSKRFMNIKLSEIASERLSNEPGGISSGKRGIKM